MKKAEKFDQMIERVIEDQITNETAIVFWVGIQQEIELAEKTGKKTVDVNAIIGRFETAVNYGKKKKQ